MQGINPMSLWSPWSDYKNKQLSINHKIKQTILRCNTKNVQGMNPMGLCDPWDNTYLHNFKLEELEKMPSSQ